MNFRWWEGDHWFGEIIPDNPRGLTYLGPGDDGKLSRCQRVPGYGSAHESCFPFGTAGPAGEPPEAQACCCEVPPPTSGTPRPAPHNLTEPDDE